jgi:hypothetical protein
MTIEAHVDMFYQEGWLRRRHVTASSGDGRWDKKSYFVSLNNVYPRTTTCGRVSVRNTDMQLQLQPQSTSAKRSLKAPVKVRPGISKPRTRFRRLSTQGIAGIISAQVCNFAAPEACAGSWW